MTELNLAIRVKSLVQVEAKDNVQGEVTRGMKGLLVSIMDRMLGDKQDRYRVLAWLFDNDTARMSSKELSDDQWRGLINWMSPSKDEDTGQWLTPAYLKSEMEAVKVAAKDWFLHGKITADLVEAPVKRFEGKKVYSVVEDVRDKQETRTPLCIFLSEDEDNLPF